MQDLTRKNSATDWRGVPTVGSAALTSRTQHVWAQMARSR